MQDFHRGSTRKHLELCFAFPRLLAANARRRQKEIWWREKEMG